MTRINLIPPSELCDKHLLAEYRELPRVFRLARPCPGAPKQYTLGKGHVKFFYDKLAFIHKRFNQLISEMATRGFKAQFLELPDFAYGLPKDLWNDYTPTPDEIAINRARIEERIAQFKRKPHAK